MRRVWGISLALLLIVAVGCDPPAMTLWNPTPARTETAAPRAAPPATPDAKPLTLVPESPAEYGASRPQRRLDVVLNVLYVRVPREARGQVEPVWNHLRENVVDGVVAARLVGNGLRIGVGHEASWAAVKAALDALDGVRAVALEPVRVPAGYPLAFELDERPREQTLFFVAADGVLTGETWPASRNVLRVHYELNLERPDTVRLVVVPEVRQRQMGWRWIRSEAGLTQVPKYGGRAFGAAGFAVDLAAGEFLLVAPGAQADVYGLIGGAFLSYEDDGQRTDSYVFLRADVNHVAQHH